MDTSRFYEQEYPKVGDLVVAKVIRIEGYMGAYVSLLEYGDIEGLILPNELSKRRFRSLHKLVKIGRQEIVMVVRIDENKGYVDLSKKRVAPEDVLRAEVRFSKSKKVYLTARQVGTKLGKTTEEINKIAIWPLYRKYGHAYDGLKIAVDKPDEAFSGIDCPKDIIDCIIEDMKPRILFESVRIKACVHVICTGFDGVEAVKNALISGEQYVSKYQKDNFSMKISLIASPLYNIQATSNDATKGLEIVREAIEVIKENITKIPGGEFNLNGEIIVSGGNEEEQSEEESNESSDEDSDEESDVDSNEEEQEDERSSDRQHMDEKSVTQSKNVDN